MRATAIIAWREIIEHRIFVVAALAAMVLVLVAPLAALLVNVSQEDVREILTVSMAFGFTTLAAVALGASTVAGTVAAGRFGFFLGRPVSGASIWFGKLIGALVVVFVCEAILLAPALTTSGLLLEQTVDGVAGLFGYGAFEALGEAVAFALPVLLPVILVLGAHAVATAWRGRTAWLGADLATVLATAALAAVALWPLVRSDAVAAVSAVSQTLLATLLVAVVAAGAVQVTAGGVDVRRHHRTFSMVLAVVLLTTSLALTVVARSASSPSAADVLRDGADVILGASGRWVAVVGVNWMGVPAGYLLDLESETAVRIDAAVLRWDSRLLAMSDSGNRAAWAVPQGRGTLQVSVADLSARPVTVKPSSIFVTRDAAIALSPDGNLLATMDQGLFSISDPERGEILASAAVGSPYTPKPMFVSDHRALVVVDLQLEPPPTQETVVTALDAVTAQSLRITPPFLAQGWYLRRDPARDRILILTRDGDEWRWRYVDQATFDDVGWARSRPLGRRTAMLADGRLVTVLHDDSMWTLEIVRPDGQVEASHQLPEELQRILRHPPVDGTSPAIRFGVQPTANGLAIEVSGVVESSSGGTRDQESRVGIIDLESGTFRDMDAARALVGAWPWEGQAVAPPAGSPASRLLRTAGGALVLWDPETGELEDLASRYE